MIWLNMLRLKMSRNEALSVVTMERPAPIRKTWVTL
jgi:hypothetical protein